MLTLAAMTRVIPFAGIQFTCYDHFDTFLQELHGAEDPRTRSFHTALSIYLKLPMYLAVSPPIYRFLAGAGAGEPCWMTVVLLSP